jgi:hypothetical protein
VRALKPTLGFDLLFHSGYRLTVPLRPLAGSGDRLTAIFRVVEEASDTNGVYFSHSWAVPPLDEEADGAVDLEGAFDLGPGRYRVDWLLRDLRGRYCTAHWKISAEPRGKERDAVLRIGPGVVRPVQRELFDREEPVARGPTHPLKLLILVHVAPQVTGAPAMRNHELAVMVSILRSIAREPAVGSFSLAAFNIDQQAVLYRQENAASIDFPALGAGIERMQLGTVRLEQLQEKNERPLFLDELLRSLLEEADLDALIFVGSKRSAATNLRISLKETTGPRCPVFYLNYDLDPNGDPWADVIGSLVRFWKGVEYTITRPHDLTLGWANIVSRLTGRPSTPGTIHKPGATGYTASK